MSDPPTDNPSVLLMAIPGAGKTRTVEEAARSIAASYDRVKLTDAHPLIQELRQLAETEKGPPKCYAAGKDVFVATCKEFVEKLIEKKSAGQNKIQVMHFDEVQLLMGSKVVSKDVESENMFDYDMPAFGDAVNFFTSERNNLRVALSGTNFCAALASNSGSHLKVKLYSLEGGFPPDHGKNLLKKHFDFHSVQDEDQDTLIEPMCANRRALQFLAYKLELRVGIHKEVSREGLQEAAEAAYRDWNTPILRCIGDGRKAALSLLALIVYPSAWNGTVTNGRLKLPSDELPNEVKQYALGGAVTIHHDVKYETDEILIPVGCTLRFLSDMCGRATDADNMNEYEFFTNASRSVLSDKGHFFERMIACELTFLSSELYKTLLSPSGMQFNPDPRMLGKPFVYNARIHQADWKRGEVYCGLEDPHFTGENIVDLGFPVVTIRGREPWRVYCAANVVRNQNNLWRICWDFFEKMKGLGVGDDKSKTVAVFLTFYKFKDFEPAPRKTTAGLSAHDSRERTLKLLSEKTTHFLVLDGEALATAKTVLPVVDLYKVIKEKEPTNHGMTELTDHVAQVYTSSSQQLQLMGRPTSKRMRTS